MTFKAMILAAGASVMLLGAPAFAASDSDAGSNHHDTAKGAAVGALAGHEMGRGHAVAGAAVGAGVGHHEGKKAQQKNGG
jgi:hypothetical protein